MSYEEILETTEDGQYRVKLVLDEYADEPYDDGQSPLIQLDIRYSGTRAEHVMVGARPADNDARIEEAAERWGSDFDKLEKYLRAYYGTSQVKTWHSGDYWYITYDTAEWRDYTGAPENSVSMDEWQAYCTGDVWGYVVERNVTWHSDENPSQTMQTWEEEDSCWGYYGYEWAKKSALEAFKYVIEPKSSAPLDISPERLAADIEDIERVAKLPPVY